MKDVKTVVKTVNKYESKPVQKLVANDANDFDWAGSSVAISADRLLLAVGAYGVNERTGAVYIYRRNAGDEAFSSDRVQKLVAADGVADDRFGSSVSLSADKSTLAVGAFRVDAGDTERTGAVYIYQRNAGDVVFGAAHVQKLKANDKTTGDMFGASVSLSADSSMLAVGAGVDTDYVSTGAVYIYQRNAGEDVFDGDHVQKLVAINGATKDWFGASVHLADGDTLAVGATGDNAGGTKAGAVYIYKQLSVIEDN